MNENEINIYEAEVIVVGAAGIDTNIYLYGKEIDFSVEANFSENIDCPGQAGFYAAFAFKNLGKNTSYLGYLGKDFTGDYLRKSFRDNDIKTLLFIDPAGTKRSINFMYSDGRRKNFYDGKGSMQLKPDLDQCRNFLQGVRIAHVNIVNWTRYLLPVIKEMKIILSVDLQDIVSADDEYRKDYIRQADYLFFSAVNFPDSIDYPAERFLQINPELRMLIGRGRDGCAYADMAGIKYFPAIEIEQPVIDTNGAGDSLAAGFLTSYLLDGFSLEEAIMRAQICSRYCCSIKADSKNLITREQLDRYFTDLWENDQ